MWDLFKFYWESKNVLYARAHYNAADSEVTSAVGRTFSDDFTLERDSDPLRVSPLIASLRFNTE